MDEVRMALGFPSPLTSTVIISQIFRHLPALPGMFILGIISQSSSLSLKKVAAPLPSAAPVPGNGAVLIPLSLLKALNLALSALLLSRTSGMSTSSLEEDVSISAGGGGKGKIRSRSWLLRMPVMGWSWSRLVLRYSTADRGRGGEVIIRWDGEAEVDTDVGNEDRS